MDSVQANQREYYIVGSAKDKSKLLKLGFHKSDYCREKLLEKKMSTEDVREFKRKSDSFNRVMHEKFGRVYELQEKSFKQYYANNI